MNIQEQVEITESLLEGVKELRDHQDGWNDVIEKAENLIKHMKRMRLMEEYGVSEEEISKSNDITPPQGI